MATEKILVERQTDGKRCGMKCPHLAMIGLMSVCCWQGRILRLNKTGDFALRCPTCLSTPPARELTPEMVEAVKEATRELAGLGLLSDDAMALALKLRAAFGIEEATK